MRRNAITSHLVSLLFEALGRLILPSITGLAISATAFFLHHWGAALAIASLSVTGLAVGLYHDFQHRIRIIHTDTGQLANTGLHMPITVKTVPDKSDKAKKKVQSFTTVTGRLPRGANKFKAGTLVLISIGQLQTMRAIPAVVQYDSEKRKAYIPVPPVKTIQQALSDAQRPGEVASARTAGPQHPIGGYDG